ncbi:MAG TPA: methyltransferase domain-containing protein [Methanolinea sp.]|jgi:SAM-dependent methyltransferase|nr:methyltransferase domain-containing protein [Methanolinea sp.]HPC55649.1 methyltransferase domain-containing protein [Methanolinea sp.]HRS92941.1 methyltransferase domain-containing protein [Methanolinea sp.]HRU79760.1 methyltransferase domain-containing protein [Methanolinea sp.]
MTPANSEEYIHGHSRREALRLSDQANTLSSLLHHDTIYQPGSLVLEAGCGVGAQTGILASRNTGTGIVSVDISIPSLRQARNAGIEGRWENVSFARADLFNLPFPDEVFDHVFLCFVLEHLRNPSAALASVRRVLTKGGTLTVIEGDHGSTFFYPGSPHANDCIRCLEELQREMGGNPRIGRELYPLLSSAGFRNIHVSPRQVYVDGSRPDLACGFTRQTFTAMVEGVRDQVLRREMMSPEDFDRGIRDLARAAGPEGVFCYTFFKAVCVK